VSRPGEQLQTFARVLWYICWQWEVVSSSYMSVHVWVPL